jgi:hypothetical protein
MKDPTNPKITFLQGMDMTGVPSSARFAVPYNYSVRVESFDDNAMKSIYYGEKFFKFSRDAKEWAEKMRDEHNRLNIVSVFSLIRLEDSYVVEVFKTKQMSKHYKKFQKLMKMKFYRR